MKFGALILLLVGIVGSCTHARSPDRPAQMGSAARDADAGMLRAMTARAGTVVFDTVDSPALTGNALGDAARRSVIVYLPPGYSDAPDRRLPVLYMLHGFGATPSMIVDGSIPGFTVQGAMDSLLAAGIVQDMIVVLPDGHNSYGGSWFTNSVVTGNWEDYVVRDVVAHIDRRYRTLPDRTGRGIYGHSMGGYGALMIAVRHPDVFSAVFASSPCCFGPRLFEDAWMQQATWRRTLALRSPADLPEAPFHVQIHVAMAAAFSPNPARPPFMVDFPLGAAGDSLAFVHGTAERWRGPPPDSLVSRYRDHLARITAVWFEVGASDSFTHIQPTLVSFSAALDRADIKHRFEVYDGNHGNRIVERFNTHVLPFMSSVLAGR